jgi:beta-galactosidase/beta-glucuronidase
MVQAAQRRLEVSHPPDASLADVAVETDRSAWAQVAVPGNWTLQGHGSPHYTNVQMPFLEEPPRVPEINPTGIHALEVDVPKSWNGCRIVLHFGGAESVLCVYVNGQFVGLGQGLPASFRIRHHRPRENRREEPSLRRGDQVVRSHIQRGPGPMVDGRAAPRGLPLFHGPGVQRVFACHGEQQRGLADYDDLFEKNPGLQGGFIWEWIDHGILRTGSGFRGI